MSDVTENAWEAELATLRTVVRGMLGPEATEHDVNQAATGVLLVCTLPASGYRAARKLIDGEDERRAKWGA